MENTGSTTGTENVNVFNAVVPPNNCMMPLDWAGPLSTATPSANVLDGNQDGSFATLVWALFVENETATVSAFAVREPDDGDAQVFQWIGTANALAEKSAASATKAMMRMAGSLLVVGAYGTATFVPRNNLSTYQCHAIPHPEKPCANCQGSRRTEVQRTVLFMKIHSRINSLRSTIRRFQL